MSTAVEIGCPGVEKLPTGIAGFDLICNGGIPVCRTTLLTGSAGSGKTMLAIQYLVAGVTEFQQHGVLVTFEEAPRDLVRNVRSMGWDLGTMIEDNEIAVVDATPEPGETPVEAGAYDLTALLARIEAAVRSIGARRVVLDALGALFPQFSDPVLVRRELQRIVVALRAMDVTTILNVERNEEDADLTRFGVEEFVADNVVILRNRLENEKRRRTIEVLKIRGSHHQKGEYPFTIDPEFGVTVIPFSTIELKQKSSEIRIPSGVPQLDEMCGGGMFRDSIVLVSGATGTGKTLLVSQFMKAAFEAGERALLFAFEESREQLIRNAASWGADFAGAERKGLLKIVCRYPEIYGLEDQFLAMKRDIEEFCPHRVAVDSLSALERVSTLKSFRQFVFGITSFVKMREICGMFTNTTSMLMGSDSITEAHISTITDSIILLRYVELHGEMRRGLTVLKMRGSWHEKDIREYVIDDRGMHIRKTFRGVTGILSGNPSYTYFEERERLSSMFGNESGG